MKQKQENIFLLTKPPASLRAELCIKLALRSGSARIYLAADGVYYLLSEIEELQPCEIYACREDLEARAIKPGEKVRVPNNFYADLLEDIMECYGRAYIF